MSNTVISQYSVTGMSCDHCVASVTRELSAIAGVESVAVDLADGLVTVTSTEPLPIDEVSGAIDEAGYDLAPVNASH